MTPDEDKKTQCDHWKNVEARERASLMATNPGGGVTITQELQKIGKEREFYCGEAQPDDPRPPPPVQPENESVPFPALP